MAKIRYQLDEHLHTAIAVQLRQRGIDVLTAHEAGMRGAADTDQLRVAFENGRVFVTIDGDYPTLSAAGAEHAGIVYFPGGLPSVGGIVRALELVHGVYSAEEMIGRLEYC